MRAALVLGAGLGLLGCSDFAKLKADAVDRFNRPVDEQAPQLDSTRPMQGATDVAVGVLFEARYSEEMNAASLQLTGEPALPTTTKTVAPGGRTATWSTHTPLPFGTQFTVTFSGEDLAGNSLPTASSQVTFTTIAQDLIAPTLVSTVPVDQASVGAASFTSVSFTFSEAIDASRFAVGVVPTLSLGPATVSADRTTFTVPVTGAAQSTAYAFTLSQVFDLANNPLSGNGALRVNTDDETPPTLVTSTPQNGGMVSAAATTRITLTFSEAMDPNLTATLAASGGAPVTMAPTQWSTDGRTATFLGVVLQQLRSYQLEVTQARDASPKHNPLAGRRTVDFITLDENTPVVLAWFWPDAGGGAAPVGGPVTVVFSEPMDVSATSLALVPDGGAFSKLASPVDAGIFTFTPTAPLLYHQTYTATVVGTDLAGNPLGGSTTTDFTTVSQCALGACDPVALCTPEVPPDQTVQCACPGGFVGDGGTCTPLLLALSLNGASLSPAFAPTQLAYSATVNDVTPQLQVLATAPPGATVTVRLQGAVVPAAAVVLPTSGGVLLLQVEVALNGRSTTYDVAVVNLQTRVTYLKPSNTGAGDGLGRAVSMSADGTVLVVGSHNEGSSGAGVNPPAQGDNSMSGAGAAYVFRRQGTSWVQEAYLKASNPGADDFFGYRLAVSGDGRTIAVGAFAEDSNGAGVNPLTQNDNSLSNSGAVYVFRRAANVWAQEAYVKASNPGNSDNFGAAVALSFDGQTLVVGAPLEDSNGVGVNPNTQTNNSVVDSGAAYVFQRSAGTWAQQAYLKATNTETLDGFGGALAVSASGNLLGIGAVGEDSSSESSPGDNSARDSGAAYFFVRSGTAWTFDKYLKAPNAGAADEFGSSIAISGDGIWVAVGAPLEDSGSTVNQADETAPQAGAVYVYQRPGTWGPPVYLKAANVGAGDRFGAAVALTSDGTALLAGGSEEDSNGVGYASTAQGNNSASNAGAAYTLVRNGLSWSPGVYLKAANTDPGDFFGWGVALSGDGSTLAVTAIAESSNFSGVNGGAAAQANNAAPSSGALYVYRRESGAPTDFLKASNAEAGDGFGVSTALSDDGNTLAVGAWCEASDGSAPTNNALACAGAVYVFARSGGVWTQQAYLKAPNADSGDRFGIALALSGDGNVLAVGAHLEDSNGVGVNSPTQGDNSSMQSGAVYVFRRAGQTWSFDGYLKSGTTMASGTFGIAVSLAGNGATLAVGAPGESSGAGAVHLFRYGSNWTYDGALFAPNASTGDAFGWSVSLSTDAATLAVGAHNEDSDGSSATNNSATDSGAVYVFTRSGSAWSAPTYLKSINPDANDYFGISLALSGAGDVLAVGAYNEGSDGVGINSGAQGNNNAASSGAVYVFRRVGLAWAHDAYLKSSNSAFGDGFGLDVALARDGRTLVAGAFGEDSNGIGVNPPTQQNNLASLSGAAYLFRRVGTAWAQESYVKASNTEANDQFATAFGLSADGSTLVCGVNQERSAGTGVNPDAQDDNSAAVSGAVYVYTMP